MRLDKEILQRAANVAAQLPAISSGVFLVLGSAQSDFVGSLDIVAEKSYAEIPSLGVATAPGHAGRLLVVAIAGKTVAVAAGRRHLYEMEDDLTPVVFPAVLAAALKCKTLILTNAAGSMQPNKMPVGTIVSMSDQINLLGIDPIGGDNGGILGVERSNGMGTLYDAELRGLVKSTGRECGLEIPEGVYLGLRGPSFETAAEIRMYSHFADLVGMSTVPEAIVWQALCLRPALRGQRRGRLLGLSIVTNLAQGLSDEEVSVAEVLSEGKNASESFQRLLEALIPKLFC